MLAIISVLLVLLAPVAFFVALEADSQHGDGMGALGTAFFSVVALAVVAVLAAVAAIVVGVSHRRSRAG